MQVNTLSGSTAVELQRLRTARGFWYGHEPGNSWCEPLYPPPTTISGIALRKRLVQLLLKPSPSINSHAIDKENLKKC